MIPHSEWLAVPLVIALGVAGALLQSGGPSRRVAAFAVALFALAVPFILPPERTFLRFFTALASIMAVFRNLDLLTDRGAWTAARRARHILLIFDSRRAKEGPPALDRAALARVALFAPLCAIGAYMVRLLGPDQPPAGLLVRWLFGGLFCYASFDVVASTSVALARAVGITAPIVHDHPIRAATVAEFWGRRWNLIIRDILFEHCFRPLARRRRARLGAVAAFLASAGFHFWLTFVALGQLWGLVIASFFVLQGAFLLVEHAMGVNRWRRALQHAWTASCIVLTSPLITEPLLRVWVDR